MSTRPLVFLDTETDGLGPHCRAWEVALVRRDEEGNEHEQHWFLPLDLRHADPQALRIGGFFDRHPSGRKVSGKPGFDADVLARLLRSEGYMPSWDHRLRDVATLASGHVHRDVGGLDGALEAVGMHMPKEERHTAMADARAAMWVYDAVMTHG